MVGRGARRQPHQRGAGAARLAHRRGRRGRARVARGRGTCRSSPASSPGVVVRPTTIVVNKSPIEGDSKVGPITWGAAQLGIAQGVLDAVAEGLIDAGEVAEVILLVAVWVDPAAGDETAVKAANRAAMRDAIADALRAALRRRRARARRPARGGGERVLHGATGCMRIASLEVRRYAVELDPPFRAAWDPEPRRRVEASLAIVRADDGTAGYAERRRPARTRRCSSGCSSAWTRAGPRWCASCARPSTCTTAGRGAPRSPSGTSRRGWRASRCGGCSAGATSGSWPTRRAASWSRRRSARGGSSRCAPRACGR